MADLPRGAAGGVVRGRAGLTAFLLSNGGWSLGMPGSVPQGVMAGLHVLAAETLPGAHSGLAMLPVMRPPPGPSAVRSSGPIPVPSFCPEQGAGRLLAVEPPASVERGALVI